MSEAFYVGSVAKEVYIIDIWFCVCMNLRNLGKGKIC